MSRKHVGKQTFKLLEPPSITANACVAGKKEGEGPLKESFDFVGEDSFFGEKTWEKAESTILKKAFEIALKKASLKEEDIRCAFAGDLLNQCISSSFAMRETGIPFFGLYGACSTMAESLALASLTVEGGFADRALAATSSHFCSAERQYRTPLNYGAQRTPTAQWTVTGAGAAIVTAEGPGPYVTHITPGKIVDAGIKDPNNMGAAMAPAAYDTLRAHFDDLKLTPEDYDLVVTGDLGLVGSEVLIDFFKSDGVELAPRYNDCGLMIFSLEEQDVHAGGSGCGCGASVLCGHLLNSMRAGRYKKILFAATGALLSPTSTMQGESIPSVCCAVSISQTR